MGDMGEPNGRIRIGLVVFLCCSLGIFMAIWHYT